jgi:hypothetical protein
MPLLGGLLVTLFSGLASFFADMFAKKVALALAYVTALGVVVVAMLAMLTVVVAPLSGLLFSQFPWLGWMGLAFPPVHSTCITALATVWSGTVLYSWQREGLRLAAGA